MTNLNILNLKNARCKTGIPALIPRVRKRPPLNLRLCGCVNSFLNENRNTEIAKVDINIKYIFLNTKL